MSSDLQWLLLKNHNSFLVKRVPEGPIFSTEPGNLRNIHSHKYSGLGNSKTISIQEVNGSIRVTTHKPSASIHKVKSAKHSTILRRNNGPRRSAGIISAHARQGYRPDLRTSALARVSALAAVARGPKPEAQKKSRATKKAEGKKAATA
ncbi:hypothetical protein BS47DRAFT_1332987 [Hydnum rufescens UP504]|uniref:Ribosomal eL28/Mak16 domain-containing protein n=1 Tax=Hydnum rufescens UP504 TaxID=1448309 RepID=A0A9P6ALC9_9AGAM|nr:hypothetical protein BS47DRAFT_1332987 [Hydnum rufescens UP504]